MDLTSTIDGPLALVLLVLGFGFIIFVHELGHFLVAKAVGIKVTQFAIGFGQAILAFRKGIGFRVGTTEPQFQQRLRDHLRSKGHTIEDGNMIPEPLAIEAARDLNLGETEYRLNWMPLGGYVKMLGQEDLDPNALSVDPRAYNNKSIAARVAVVSAGVIMNGIFAILFFVVAFLWGVQFPPAQIGDVLPGSPAAKVAADGHPDIVGLAPGDQVVLVDGAAPSDFTAIKVASALAAGGSSIDLVVDRPSLDNGPATRLRFNIVPEASEQLEGLKIVGVSPPPSLSVIQTTSDDAPMTKLLAEQGLRPGMTITHAGDRPIDGYWQLDRLLQAAGGKPLPIKLRDDAGEVTVNLTPQTGMTIVTAPLNANSSVQEIAHLLGIVPATFVAAVAPDMPAFGKLETGDLIAALDGRPWPTPEEVSQIIAASTGPVEFELIRKDQRVALRIEPQQRIGQPPRVGFSPAWAMDRAMVGRVMDGSPLASLSIRPGTRIQKVAGTPVATFSDIRLALQNAAPGQVDFELVLPLAGGQVETASATLGADALASVGKLRWEAQNMPPLSPMLEMQRASNALEAVTIGIEKTHLFMLQTYITLARLVEGEVQVRNLRGPLGIAVEGTAITKRGGAYLMFFLGLISINLAVINFLPLPIVDGGLFVLLMIEKLRGKPVSPQIQSAITVAGLLLLGTIFLMVTYHDIGRLITGG